MQVDVKNKLTCLSWAKNAKKEKVAEEHLEIKATNEANRKELHVTQIRSGL